MNLKKILGRWLWLFLICHLAMLIGLPSLEAEEPNTKAVNKIQNRAGSHEKKPKGVEAVAVYYANRYQGRRTHSGVIFDQKKMTAAHPTLPHGTRVKVVNLANRRSCVVTINDRCRKRPFEMIDLSKAAARKLGFLRKGSARVRLIAMQTDP